MRTLAVFMTEIILKRLPSGSDLRKLKAALKEIKSAA